MELIENRNINEDDGFVKEWVQKLSNGQPNSLRVFIESLGPEIKSGSRVTRESAVKRICLVVSRLPTTYAWHLSEVELLLDFFLMNYDSFDSPDCVILGAFKSLIMNGPHVSSGYIQIIVEKLFHQGQVQMCGQKERYIFYQILDLLLDKYDEELSSNVYFVSYFISSISGERDPRCLVIVFRLFCSVCGCFNSGKFPRKVFDIHVNDLFDVVACYYPIEFKQRSEERTGITRELLVSGCESCLLADDDFAPFVFQLIVEKITDDEYSLGTKLEVCTFLAKVCNTLPGSHLNGQVDELCAAIRSILLNLPISLKGIPESVEVAVTSLLKALEKNSKNGMQLIEHVCQEFIENSEMFVLQAELGLSERVLSFFEILIKSCELSMDVVFENVFSWLLTLCKGDTANFAANKSEIIDESLKILCHWIDLAHRFKQAKHMQKYHTKFIEMLDKYDREIAQITRYKLLTVCIDMHLENDGLLAKCNVFLRRSFNFACSLNKDLRRVCLLFAHTFATVSWINVKTVLANEIANSKEITCLVPVLWSTIHDLDSLDFALTHLTTLLPSTSAWPDDIQETFLEMLRLNKSKNNALQVSLLKHVLMCCFSMLELKSDSDQDRDAIAKFLQQIGLVFEDKTHLEGLHLIQEKMRACPSLLPGLYLYIIQSTDSEEILSILAHLSSTGSEFNWYKSLIMAAAINKSPHYEETYARVSEIWENVHFMDSFVFRCRLCAAFLLAGRSEGSFFFKELLHDFVAQCDSANVHSLTNAMVDMLSFDKCYSDPEKCNYHTTLLWQQRVFCQLVPIYVHYFNDLGKDSCRRVPLFALLSPLFSLAGTSTVTMNDKYVELLPVLCAALDSPELDTSLEELVISGLGKLLRNTTSKQLSDDFLLKMLPRLQHSLDNSNDMKVHLETLECLRLIAERWPVSTLLPFYSPIVCSLIRTARSHKKIIRRAVANVRNLWELLPTK